MNCCLKKKKKKNQSGLTPYSLSGGLGGHSIYPKIPYNISFQKRIICPGGGGHLRNFWVSMCCPGLQIATPF